jgi:Flp pilus assembly protein TadB
MCGKRLRLHWLGLAALLLLLPAISWAEDYTGPTLPEGWYPIHETELAELETLSQTQNETLQRQAITLTTLSQTIERLSSTLTEQQRSFDAYARGVRGRVRDAYIVGGAIGLAVGVVAVTAVVLLVQ